MLEEIGNATLAIQVLMLSAVTDFRVPHIIWKLDFGSGDRF